MPRKGQIYQWSEVPGVGNGFLRHGDGQILSAALHLDLNPDAPAIILVGRGTQRKASACVLCNQDTPIGVYLFRGTNRWEYAGEFFVERSSEALEEIRKHEARAKRTDVVRVIHLKEVDSRA